MLFVTGQIVEGKPVIQASVNGETRDLPGIFFTYAPADFVQQVQFLQIRDSFTVGSHNFSPGDYLVVQGGEVVGMTAADFKAALQATSNAISAILLQVASSKARGETPLYPDAAK